jgi:adenylate kinase
VIIFDLEQSLSDANIAIDMISSAEFHDDKTLICISSYLTWAQTPKTFMPEEEAEEAAEEGAPPPPKPKPIPNPFTEADKRKRVAHPQYAQHLTFEKMLMRLDKTQHGRLHTVVLTPGIIYGDGEDLLHAWFKMGWDGEPAGLPLFGEDGSNFVPTIHVFDMAEIVRRTALDEEHKNNLILCVDKGRHTQLEIGRALARVLGTNKVTALGKEKTEIACRSERPPADVLPASLFAFAELPPTPLMATSLEADVPFDGPIVHGWESFRWHCADFVKGMPKVVREFKRKRNLQPVRIFVHGPPGVGKTTLATRISAAYQIEHINLKKVIEYYRTKVCLLCRLCPLLISVLCAVFSCLLSFCVYSRRRSL